MSLAIAQMDLYQYGGAPLLIVGIVGCILSLLIFSTKNLRKNPCSIYFIAYNIANLCQICTSFLQAILAYGYNIDIASSNTFLCPFICYIGYVFDILSPFYLTLASIDRMLVTSRNARTRQRSTTHLAYKCIICGTICWILFHIHALISFRIIEIIPNYYICYSGSNVYLAFANYYALTKTITIPILMLICEIIVFVHFIFVSMVLLADWLPKSYHINQVTIIALGVWGIIQYESVIQVELIIVFVHFIFVSMVLLADWLPKSYHINQVTIIALGVWGIIQYESVIQVELLMLIKLISILVDSIAIGMYFQIGKHAYATQHHTTYFTISAFFAIFLLVLKPVMLLLISHVRQERLNNAVFDSWTPTSGYASVGGR
ncbi:unnamed protein product [Adineta steineri]|uniref:G-protein coupled receptors family 1 profile domain-containing protein n=1 Tax=Adineta steineri TaxID=433720 RepID=A0A814RKF9_9BILA|nr:unnamed protein product [Adineta steineri]